LLLAFALALLAAAAALIPVLAGYDAAAGRNQVFLGFIRSDDFHRYGSFMEQARVDGRFLFLDLSSTGPQSPRLLAIYFWLLGVIARLLGCASVTVWHFSGPASSLLLALALLALARRLLLQPRALNAALTLVFLGAGWEWAAGMLGWRDPRPRNSWMDGFSIFSLQHNPLKIAALAASLALLALVLRLAERRRPRDPALLLLPFWIALLWALHPNTAIVAYGAMTGGLGLHLLRRRDRATLGTTLRIGLVALPGFLAAGGYILWMRREPVIAHIITCYQIPGLHEPLRNFPVRYGFLLLLAIPGAVLAWRRNQLGWNLVLACLATGVICSQNRYLTGILFQQTIAIPLALLSTLALVRLLRRPRALIAACVLLTATFLVQDALMLRTATRQTVADVWPTSLYLHRDAWQLIQRLAERPPGGVLANRDLGNKIAYLARKPVFLGHWGTTPNRRRKEALFKRFLQRPNEAFRQRLFERYHLRYFLYGPDERRVMPVLPEPLTPIDRQGEYVLCEYRKSSSRKMLQGARAGREARGVVGKDQPGTIKRADAGG
jgi:hypothetical protein